MILYDILLSSLFVSVIESYRFLNVRISLVCFAGKDGENRTSDLTVHNLTSCLRDEFRRN